MGEECIRKCGRRSAFVNANGRGVVREGRDWGMTLSCGGAPPTNVRLGGVGDACVHVKLSHERRVLDGRSKAHHRGTKPWGHAGEAYVEKAST